MIDENLPKFLLLPERNSYNLEFGDNVLRTKFASGRTRQRLNGDDAPHVTPVTFRLKTKQQDYLNAFYRLYKSSYFAMMLIADTTSLEWYECQFIGKASLKQLGANFYEWTNQIEITPQPLDIDKSKVTVAIFNMTNGEPSKFNDMMEKYVNVDLPQAMRGLE